MHRALQPVVCTALMTLAIALPTQAGQITQVTVYPDRAGITMEKELTLEAGEGILSIDGLPTRLDVNTVRVRASGPQGMRLGALETRTIPGRDLAHPREQALTEQLQELEDEKRHIDDRIRAHQVQMRLIEQLGTHPEALPDSAEWPQAWERVGEGALGVLDAIHQQERARRTLEADIERVRRELEQLQSGRRDSLQARIHYHSPEAASATVTLEYTVPDARWTPLYEARLDTDTQELRLIQRAEVRQNTGQDWLDIPLYLSTAQPRLGGYLPVPPPWYLDVPRPAPTTTRLSRSLPEAAMAAEADTAQLEGTTFTARYRVPGRVNIASDNQPHRHNLGEEVMEARLSVRAAPRMAPRAYLFAESVFEGETPLLPGPLTLFQDGALVGQHRLAGLRPNSELDMAFGVDERVGIDYQLERDDKGQEGRLRRQNRLQRSHLMTIHNSHGRDVEVTLLDRLPVSRDERITVTLADDASEPSERDMNDDRGLLAWHRTVEAGEELTLRFSYTVTWPDDMDTPSGLR
ncbi:MAG: mucoidy inhibitor MuiA family protein [Chromatiaceae bacterium]|nr:MAG: mucoidy inhibitor MuiA family protein [Chromatiaceae bacterium]